MVIETDIVPEPDWNEERTVVFTNTISSPLVIPVVRIDIISFFLSRESYTDFSDFKNIEYKCEINNRKVFFLENLRLTSPDKPVSKGWRWEAEAYTKLGDQDRWVVNLFKGSVQAPHMSQGLGIMSYVMSFFISSLRNDLKYLMSKYPDDYRKRVFVNPFRLSSVDAEEHPENWARRDAYYAKFGFKIDTDSRGNGRAYVDSFFDLRPAINGSKVKEVHWSFEETCEMVEREYGRAIASVVSEQSKEKESKPKRSGPLPFWKLKI